MKIRDRIRFHHALFAAPLVGPLLLLPYPRFDGPMLVIYGVGSCLLLRLIQDGYARYLALPLALCSYGVLVSGSAWQRALFSHDVYAPWPELGLAPMHAGGVAWFAVGVLAVALTAYRVPRGPLLSGLALVGAVQGGVALIEQWTAPHLWFIEDPEGWRRVGLTDSAGFLGMWGMVGTLASVSLSGRWRALLAPSLVGLLLSGTLSAIGGLFIGSWMLWRKNRLAGFSIVLMGLVVAVMLFPERMEGRLDMWREVAATLSVAGHGFAGFTHWLGSMEIANHPHSIPLEMVHALGVVAVVPITLWSYGLTRLRGVPLAIGAALTVYMLFWIPSPGLFICLAMVASWMVQKERALQLESSFCCKERR